MNRHVKILGFLLVSAVVFWGCKKDKPAPDESLDPDDAFELPYSLEGVEANKSFVEQEGRTIVDKIEGLANTPAINALNELATLGLPDIDFTVSSMVRIGRQSNKVAAISHSLTTMAEAAGTTRWNSYYGIYEYNFQQDDWIKTAASDKLEFRFPAESGITANNAVLTVVYETDGQMVTIDDEHVELPTAVKATLGVAGQPVLNLISSYAYESDGLPKKIDIALHVGGYRATLTAEKGATTGAVVEFAVGEEVLMEARLSAETANFNLDMLEDDEVLADLIRESNASLRLGKIQLVGLFNVNRFIDAIPDSEYPDYPNYHDYFTGHEEHGSAEYEAAQMAYNQAYLEYRTAYEAIEERDVQAELTALNANSRFAAVNLGTKERIATIDFQMYQEEYCFYLDYAAVHEFCEVYYDYEPVLVFGDDSRISFEEFADTGFDRLISDLEDLIEKFD